MSNIFTTLANREHENDSKLGMPSTSLSTTSVA